MRTLVLIALAGLCTSCTSTYWARPGASLAELASESDACYAAAIDIDAPAALPGPSGGPRLLPRSTPPPRLWARAPRQAAFEHFHEQLAYDRCMRVQGWEPARMSVPAL
jgi:hypothetical protein